MIKWIIASPFLFVGMGMMYFGAMVAWVGEWITDLEL